MKPYVNCLIPELAPSNTPRQDVVEWEEKILKFEEILLDALCFDLVVDQAHGFLCDALDELSVTGYQAELAWSITSDSYVLLGSSTIFSAEVCVCLVIEPLFASSASPTLSPALHIYSL